jgi:hypothetical protein
MCRIPIHSLCAAILAAVFTVLFGASCGMANSPGFESGMARPLVQRPGDQIHPAVAGDQLAWFDLEGDPNGACFVPPGGQDYDRTCDGVVKTLDRWTGEVRTLSEVLGQEVRPVVTQDLVAWRCHQDTEPGLCVTPADRREVVFHRGVGWSRQSYDASSRPVVHEGMAYWAEYRTHENKPTYRLMQADLHTGVQKILLYLDALPDEVAAFDSRVVWKNSFWEADAQEYRCIIRALHLETNQWNVVADNHEYCFGLGASGDVLAWKQAEVEYGYVDTDSIRVFHLDAAGNVYRASSHEARVSADLPVVVGAGFLVWLDYREGIYRVAALDLLGRREAFLSPENAMISAYISPAAGDRSVIWTDYRHGDSDLYLFRY